MFAKVFKTSGFIYDKIHYCTNNLMILNSKLRKEWIGHYFFANGC